MLARALAGRGFRVALIIAGDKQALNGSKDGVDVIVHPPIRSGDRARDTLARTLQTLSVMARTPARVFVQRGASGAAGLARLASWTRRARFVYSSANVFDFTFEQIEPSRRTRSLYELGVRRADEIVVQTSEQVAMCEATFERHPRLIRSVAEPQPARSAAPEAFLWVGRTAAYKRPELYVELAKRVPEAHFWMIMVPSGPGQREVETRVRALLDQAPNLTLLPQRSRPEVGELLERTVAVVNTSDYEGFSNVVLEAWARGVPSIALTHDPDGVIERERLGGFADGSIERMVELARETWEQRDDQAAVAARCRQRIATHHAADVVVDAWCAALGLRGSR